MCSYTMEYIYINQELGIDTDGVQGTLPHYVACGILP